MADDVVAFMVGVAMFQGVHQKDLSALASDSTRRTFEPGVTVLAEGETPEAIYIVVSGTLDVILPAAPENGTRLSPVRLNRLSTGDYFGEYALLDARPASASVVAQDAGVLLQIPIARLRSALESNDRLGRIVYRNILTALVQRLRRKDAELDLEFEL